MSAKMTLRERVSTALKGDMPDQVPFTCYSGIAPAGEAGQRLRNLGLAVVSRAAPYRVRRPHVKVGEQDITGEAYPAKLYTHTTPVGTLTQKVLIEPGYGSRWVKEHLVKRPEDYAILEFIFRDEVYEPDIDGFLEKDQAIGDDGTALPRAADPPMQELWRRYTGLERFSYDWHDCCDEVQRVLDAMAERSRTIWKICANTPSDFCCSGGNISGDMVGPPMFNQLIMPHFQAEAEAMHKVGKRTVNHMDGMLRSLLEVIARCPVNVIEAFNPTPDGNVSVAEARTAWPEKAVSINFPSSIHLATMADIRATTIDLLRQASPGNGFIVGITENVPSNVIEKTLPVIAETLNEHGRCPVDGDYLPE